MRPGGDGRAQGTSGGGSSIAPASINGSFSRSHVRLQMFRKIGLLTIVIVTPPTVSCFCPSGCSLSLAGSSRLLSSRSWGVARLSLVFVSCLRALSVGDI